MVTPRVIVDQSYSSRTGQTGLTLSAYAIDPTGNTTGTVIGTINNVRKGLTPLALPSAYFSVGGSEIAGWTLNVGPFPITVPMTVTLISGTQVVQYPIFIGPGAVAPPVVGIATPVINYLSASGANPFTWTLVDDVSYLPGYYFHAQRNSTSTFPPGFRTVVINGDSWDVDYNGYYAGYWKAQNTNIQVANIALGGRYIGTVGGPDPNTLCNTESRVIALAPAVYYAGDGANDLANFASGAAFCVQLRAHFQRIKDALPNVKLIGRTICALGTGTGGAAVHNANRPAANTIIRSWVTEGFLSGVVDFAANSSIGDDADMIPAAASNTTISIDGVHLYDRAGVSTGHDIASPIFATALNTVYATVPTLNGEAIQQITTADLAGTTIITLTDMGVTPTGPLYFRLRIGREDGNGGYVWSSWSNVLTDTIAASFNATFAAANRTNFGGQTGTISNSGKTYAGYDFASDVTFRCSTNTPLSNAIGVVEFTPALGVSGSAISGQSAFGIVNSSYDYSGAGTNLGGTNSFAVRRDVGAGAGIYAGGSLITQTPAIAVGSTYIMIVHKATGKVWIRYPGGTYYPDTPTFNVDGSIASGTGFASGLSNFQFACGTNRDETWTINAGQSSFSQSLPTNATAGWA